MKLPFKRLKIVEQFAIVIFFAVIIPLLTISIIINNINQQGIRKELRQSALLTADILAQRITSLQLHVKTSLDDIILAIKYIPSLDGKKKYIDELENKSKTFEKLSIINFDSQVSDNQIKMTDSNEILAQIPISRNKAVEVAYDEKFLSHELLQNFGDDKRQFYVLDNNGKLLVAHNFDEKEFNNTYSLLPTKLINDTPTIFGDIKNQPLAYYKLSNLDILIIVNTTEKVTQKTITKASTRIFLSFIIAVCTILFVVGLYISYLYINMRQLFKGLTAVTKGNYKRKVRLLVSIFTPHEIVFVVNEFNKMVNEINKSYKELHQKNIELKKLDEFRSNLIDTVSHEFRTPLTSIQGYTSRLLRQDIQIDEETKNKSLKIIKRQSERLSHMVEDLLSIPDIENSKLRISLEPVNIQDVFDISVSALTNSDESRFHVDIQEEITSVLANKDKLEQVLINVLENALKYSDEDSVINLTARKNRNNVIISVENTADYIPKEILSKLFEKFTRVDDKTTRETRGTGLGLYIVKGVVKAMKGEVNIFSTEDRKFIIEIKLKDANNE